jgi:hypothetical protein
MQNGAKVEVFSQFDGSWLPGFRLEREECDERGRVAARFVRRITDGSVIPRPFPAREVRLMRRPGRLAV